MLSSKRKWLNENEIHKIDDDGDEEKTKWIYANSGIFAIVRCDWYDQLDAMWSRRPSGRAYSQWRMQCNGDEREKPKWTQSNHVYAKCLRKKSIKADRKDKLPQSYEWNINFNLYLLLTSSIGLKHRSRSIVMLQHTCRSARTHTHRNRNEPNRRSITHDRLQPHQ